MNFVDVSGRSGKTYRFRRWPPVGAHPPIAGNFVLVAASNHAVLGVGVLDDLSRASMVLAEHLADAALFTRLNISRRLREEEHADLSLEHREIRNLRGEPAAEARSPEKSAAQSDLLGDRDR